MHAVLTTLMSAVRLRLRRRRAIGELAVLSDGALKDIGLHRSHIRSVVEENLDGSLQRGRNPGGAQDLGLNRAPIDRIHFEK